MFHTKQKVYNSEIASCTKRKGGEERERGWKERERESKEMAANG